MTPELAAFLLDILNRQQLAVGAPDFEHTAQRVIEARRVLAGIATPLTPAAPPVEPPPPV